MGFLRRRVVTALATANALKPLGGYPGPLGSVYGWPTRNIFSFGLGWPVNELAPHLLVQTAADTALAVARGKASKGSLAVAAFTAAGLGYLMRRASAAGPLAERALSESLGSDYLSKIPGGAANVSLKPKLRELVRPFPRTQPGVEVLRDISYRDGERGTRLDIFRPAGVDLTGAPVLIQVHGGAWTIGDKRFEGQLLMNRMAQRGWVCVAVNYRLAPKHLFPAQIVDVKTAIAWTKEHIAEYGGDPDYAAVTGGSAGGHLAALAALTPRVKEYQPGFEDVDTSVAACVPFYGVHDLAGVGGDRASVDHRDEFLGPRVFKLDPEFRREVFELASPLLHVKPDSPDFFVLHGEADTVVPVSQGRAFAAKLREVSDGVVTYLELPLAQHGFDAFNSVRAQQAVRAVERWLEWHRANRRTAATSAAATDEDAPSGARAGR
ncbi:alpha/beta hydrolase fold domain-containing protein [Amycolatopsis silviterrae]|uniref:Alpha/beta hydrolase fold domain-containing protein n=1 Tax=Amycolatopsis silviterrae TaxID=1656914 RepID=A0ABW5HK89_9PSEU